MLLGRPAPSASLNRPHRSAIVVEFLVRRVGVALVATVGLLLYYITVLSRYGHHLHLSPRVSPPHTCAARVSHEIDVEILFLFCLAAF